MEVIEMKLPGMLLIKPRVFRDDRGSFHESFQSERYRAAGIDLDFVQDNMSRSSKNTVRGLHYQIEHPQGKLVSAVQGAVFDVAVDLRRDSPTFGQWDSVVIDSDNAWQVYVPPGLAHGFCALADNTIFTYKCTDYYFPEHERVLLWNDPSLEIDWPTRIAALSDRDRRGVRFAEAQTFVESPIACAYSNSGFEAV